MNPIFFLLWFSYILWGPVLTLTILYFGARYSADRPLLSLLYVPSSALIASALAAPLLFGGPGFALPGAWWLRFIGRQRGLNFVFGSFMNTVFVFSFVGLVILLLIVGYRAVNKPTKQP